MSADRNNPVLRYFEAEMRYLHEASQEFAKAHPDVARRLGLTQLGGRDDSVEQLFQGFAFLMARLRQKLDDELPEITEPLTSTLWPYMVRTIPSLAILECVPRDGQPPSDVIPAGLTVRSNPVGPARTICLYRTTQPVRVLPLKLREAGSLVRLDGRSALRLGFDLRRFDQCALGDLSRIRLYVHGDRPVASALYAALTRNVQSIDVRIPSIHDARLEPQPQMKLEAAGFGPHTRLWPDDDPERSAQLDAEQGLLEYFTFPEKYHFIDLCGFDAASVPEGETHVEFEVVLKQQLAADITFDASNLRLHCTPVINLFELDAEPIQTEAHQREYLVRAPRSAGAHVEPYAPASVVAIDHQTAEKHEYVAFSTFKHRGGMLRHEAPERYFHTRNVWGPSDAREMWLMLDGQAWQAPGSVPDTHVAVRMVASNGMLPRLALREATLMEPTSAFPGIEAVRNLTQPTLAAYPPQGERYEWLVMSHFAPNGLSYLDTDVLREILSLYDWRADSHNQRRIEAVREVRLRVLQIYLKRGVEIEVTLDPGGFTGPGDIALFGDVLSRFVARYASLHLFVQLVLLVDGHRTEYPRSNFNGAVL